MDSEVRPAPGMGSEEDFLTVTEAACRLGVDPRQIRRWMDRLEPKDKGQDTQRTHKGHPIVLVRVSAVEALQKGDSPQQEPKDTAKGQGKGQRECPVRVSDAKDRTQGARDRTLSDRNVRVSEEGSELVEQLRSEVASLREALATSQRLTDQAQQLQLMTERRAAVLEAENEKLKALPPMAASSAQDAPGGPESSPSVPGGASAPPAPRDGFLRGFLRRWW